MLALCGSNCNGCSSCLKTAHKHNACMQVAEGEQGSRVPVVDRLKQKAGPDALVSPTCRAAMLTLRASC